ncbi:UPF0149 family protein [Thalassotalea sp. HSM 43]|uniref:UPF0149 family protein n=1 Tax=Thalassotalea sp. HSM 43 TaxID=2552945 RepID=UPI0010806E37|nr:UPF0149 family protein [Thalassotalea sp. HSM 43]QBY03584.1 UPF0149 family protein [Thalassotalea sp. HSM 43]
MSDSNSLDFSSVQNALGGENFSAHASEIHGLLTGVIAAGFAYEDDSYLTFVSDFFNNGEGLGKTLKDLIKTMYSDIWQAVLDDNFSFQLLIPDDDESLIERGQALGHWVQGFNLGFGLQQKDNKKFSEDVKEIINDFANIANLSTDLEEDEDTENAYFELMEYVRISSLLCFAELGAKPSQRSPNKTLH